MTKHLIFNYTVIALSGFCLQPLAALAEEKDDKLEELIIYGEHGVTNTATSLDLTIFETPQTVTAISRLQMDEFLLDKANQVLKYTPGVTVEEVETHRSYYTARGFDILNFQYDGLGTPFAYGLVQGQADTAIYEKVEVVKGAAGLITGLANPSATVNFVRKRPTKNLLANARVSVNDWSAYRLDGDVSGSMSSAIRGRAVMATADGDSYLDRHKESTQLVYGVVDFDLTKYTLLTVGHSDDNNEADGVLWGALPLAYADGTPTDYDVSTSTAPDWTFRHTEENKSFVDLKQQLGAQWALNATYSQTKTGIESDLFYVFGTPERDETGLGASMGNYQDDIDRDMLDLYASGYFSIAGRQHQLVVGYNRAKVGIKGQGYRNDAVGSPALGPDWAEGNTLRPDFIDDGGSSDVEQNYESIYVATRFSLTDDLAVLLGARNAEYEQTGISYGADATQAADKTVPYYGLTYQIIDSLMAYGSYSEVFSPQVFVDTELKPLGPIEGESSELGLKLSSNSERTVLTFAMFESKIGNYGVFLGNDPETGVNTYDPNDQNSSGFEIEITGQLNESLNISAGYTKVNIEDASGEKVPYIPEQLLKVSTSYRIPGAPKLKVGGALKWQDDTTNSPGTAEQEAFAELDLMAQYALNKQFSLSLNIGNVTDEKYLTSLYWDQGYYGAPRNVSFSANWTL